MWGLLIIGAAIGLAAGITFTGYFMSKWHEKERAGVAAFVTRHVADCRCCLFHDHCFNGYDREDDCFAWDERLDH